MGFAGKHENERPVHEVSISRGFWIGETEVTQAQFATILELPSQRFVGEKLPVHNISWTDAREFCARLTKRERSVGLLPEGYVYRLPTEAEWEYACRAGTARAFGANPQAMTWHTGNAEAQAKPVAERLPNPWGIHDMHGNVLEWCLDGISEYPEESQIDPLRGGHEKIKITRGGAWTKPLKFCRSSHRHSWLFGLKKSDIGFRVVLAPDLAHRD
jgi:formylglycine-generating enzyme required for sulfatase activity